MLITVSMTNDIWSFILFFISTISLCIFMLILGYLLGERNNIITKNIPFESGIDSIQSSRLRLSIKFYLIAVFFVIFDVEAIYLYSWSVTMRETSWIGFTEAVIFIFVMLISLFYLVRMKALD